MPRKKMNFDHQAIEKKWQAYWKKHQTFEVKNSAENPNQKKFYALDMFPYPSGAGLHVGHPLGYTATDILSRKKRMEGYQVLHPMGWDAFGLPAENYAIKTGIHPAESTAQNINNFRRQIQSLGLSYDWSREIDSTDPSYYHWTQWIFLQFYRRDMLYEDQRPMNWCDHCRVVVANEEVENGRHERCGTPVTEKDLPQWLFRITDYADRLLKDLSAPNIVMIHGWEGKGNQGWFKDLKKFWEAHGVEVHSPDFPNSNAPVYGEWKAFFEQNLRGKINECTILLGHSLGGGFIQRYLSEASLKVAEIVLIAPTINDCGIPPISNFFSVPFDYQRIKNSADNIFIYSGGKDPFIPASDGKFLVEKLSAHYRFFPDCGHWGQSELEHHAELQPYARGVVDSILDWPESIKSMQSHWIGKSQGAEVDFGTEFSAENSSNTKKRRNEKGCTKDNEPLSPTLGSTLFLELEQVKKKGGTVDLKRAELVTSLKKEILVDPQLVFAHFSHKPKKERKFREEYFLSVLQALPRLTYQSEQVGYFLCRERVFRVVFTKNKKNQLILKTYYQSKKLTKAYKEWIQFKFSAENSSSITVYTTRPDTLWGVTYFVLSPEHPLVPQFTTAEQQAAVEAYQAQAKSQTELERTNAEREKTGVFTGGYVINPVNQERVPVWVADYVLMNYGTGAVMAVPAHDERDYEFAQKYQLPIKVVVEPPADFSAENSLEAGTAYFGKEGTIKNSAEFLNGVSVKPAIEKVTTWLAENKLGRAKTNYKLRDWIFTRQRYWGEPIPLVFDPDGKCYPLHESELPLELPSTPNYQPSETGESPLSKIKEWVEVRGDIQPDGSVRTSPQGKILFRRETSTMPNWAGSSWYWLRFMDPQNQESFCSPSAENAWGPVDCYVGGAEHAVLHLLYGRYWHKALYDLGLVHTREPFKKLVNQGLIISYAYENAAGGLIPIDEVEEVAKGKFKHQKTGESVTRVTAKMSKSLKNVVNPDDIVAEFGADTLRCYEMFMGPFEASKQWSHGAIGGVRRWLERVWRLQEKVSAENSAHKKKKDGECFPKENWATSFFFRHNLFQNLSIVNKKRATHPLKGLFHKVCLEKHELIFDGKLLDKHFYKKEQPLESRYRKQWRETIIKALPSLYFTEDLIGYFVCKNMVFRVVFTKTETGAKRVKTYYRCRNLTKEYLRVTAKVSAENSVADKKSTQLFHQTIKLVGEHIDSFRFNTAISQLMILTNDWTAQPQISAENFGTLTRLLAPFAPHLAEELWARLGNEGSLAYAPWPVFDPRFLELEEVTYVVQINGKVRADFVAEISAEKSAVLQMAKDLPKIKKWMEGQTLVKEVFVPRKLVGLVLK